MNSVQFKRGRPCPVGDSEVQRVQVVMTVIADGLYGNGSACVSLGERSLLLLLQAANFAFPPAHLREDVLNPPQSY